LTIAAALAAGCSPRLALDALTADRQALRIATDWSQAEREAIARDFATWVRERPAGSPTVSSSIVWLAMPDEPRLDQANPPDVLLGGPLSFYVRLASQDQLESLGGGPDRPQWTSSRRSIVGLIVTEGTPSTGNPLALADPRVDPLTLAWGLGRLRADGWPTSYARLIDLFGRAEAVGWRAGSARADVDRDQADATITRLDGQSATATDSVVVDEGAAIRRGSRRTTAARAFLQFLDERRGDRDKASDEKPAPVVPEAERLAADLLGATLVDAQDELRKAVEEVRKAGSPAAAVELLTQLPPWPPASVAKLLKKGGEGAATLVETLAGQVAPDSEPRAWLMRSWLRPTKPIDGEFLTELALADGGRLAREPRFRAWLRAEWTQWARQRYRWVARLTAAHSPLVTSTRSSEP
jgi:hypothetical protein